MRSGAATRLLASGLLVLATGCVTSVSDESGDAATRSGPAADLAVSVTGGTDVVRNLCKQGLRELFPSVVTHGRVAGPSREDAARELASVLDPRVFAGTSRRPALEVDYQLAVDAGGSPWVLFPVISALVIPGKWSHVEVASDARTRVRELGELREQGEASFSTWIGIPLLFHAMTGSWSEDRVDAHREHCRRIASAIVAELESREDALWRVADDGDDIAAYEMFLTLHPRSERVAEAEAALEELYWWRASQTGEGAAYLAYLARFPGGRHEDRAQQEGDDAIWRWIEAEPAVARLAEADRRDEPGTAQAWDAVRRAAARAELYLHFVEGAVRRGDAARVRNLAAGCHTRLTQDGAGGVGRSGGCPPGTPRALEKLHREQVAAKLAELGHAGSGIVMVETHPPGAPPSVGTMEDTR